MHMGDRTKSGQQDIEPVDDQLYRTKRGQQDREREDDKMFGEPLDKHEGGDAATQPANVTRDQGVEPADDTEEKETADKQS